MKRAVRVVLFLRLTEIGRVAGSHFVRTGVNSTNEISLFLVHVDRSGNESGEASINVTPAALPEGSVRFIYGQPQIPFLVKGRAITSTDPFVLPAVTGGATPYTFTASGLPAGLTFNTTNRTVTGTPTVSGTFYVYFVAEDADGVRDAIFVPIQVREAVFEFADDELSVPTLIKDVAIDDTNDPFVLPSATGGSGNLSYSTNPLPNGLTFDDATLQITGTPTVAGQFRLILSVEDADSDTDHFVVEFKIDEPGTSFVDPLSPAGITAGAAGDNTTVNSNNEYPIAWTSAGSFFTQIEWQKEVDLYDTTVFQNVGSIDLWESNYTIGNLEIGSTYRWRLRHVNPIGETSAWTAYVEFDTLSVEAPSGVTAGSAVNANNELPVTWTSSGNFFTRLQWQKEVPNYGTTVWSNVGEVDEWSQSYTIGNLDIDSTYRWRMRHISPLGEEGAWTAFAAVYDSLSSSGRDTYTDWC